MATQIPSDHPLWAAFVAWLDGQPSWSTIAQWRDNYTAQLWQVFLAGIEAAAVRGETVVAASTATGEVATLDPPEPIRPRN